MGSSLNQDPSWNSFSKRTVLYGETYSRELPINWKASSTGLISIDGVLALEATNTPVRVILSINLRHGLLARLPIRIC